MIKPIIILSALVSLVGFPQQTTYERVPEVKIEVIEVKEETTELPLELKRICSCESTGSPNNEPRHYDSDGSVLRGKVNPDDIGSCQINQHYWLGQAQEFGYDIFTPEGNKLMALWIYETKGSQPWFWSKKCWLLTGQK